MQQYEEFLERLNSYFQYDEVHSEGTIISAYDLLQIIQTEMHEYYVTIRNNSDFKKVINDFYATQIPFGRLFRKLKKINTVSVDYISYSFEKNHARVVVKFNGESFINSKYIRLCKDSDTDELYFDKSGDKDKEFVEQFHDQILHDLQKMEELYHLFKLTFPNIKEVPDYHDNSKINEEISDDFLKIAINYDSRGRVDCKIMIDPSVDPDNVYAREWLNHESIKDYVERNRDELLKKIAINVLDLKETTQAIITAYYTKNNTDDHKLKLK